MSKGVLYFVLVLHSVMVYTQLLEEQRVVSYQRCLLDADCQRVSDNSFCFGNDDNKVGICKCTSGYELLSRNRTFFACLQNVGWDESCEKDVQCYFMLSNNAECDTTCKCKEGSHLYTDGRCYPSIRLGDYCQTSANCLLKDSTFGNCVDGKCECKFDKQMPTEDAMSCVDSKNLGEPCDNNDQCSFILDAICRVTCRCSSGFVMSRDENKCLKAATTFFEQCQENAQCSEFLQGSSCNNGNCTCQDGFHGFGSKCARSVEIGGSCTGIEECVPDEKYSAVANCTDGICRCLPGAVDETVGCNSCRTFHSFGVIIACNLYLLFRYYLA